MPYSEDEMASCFGKKPFASAHAAIAYTGTKSELRKQRIYRCRHCGFWHYGNGRPQMRVGDKRWKNWHWRDAVADP